MNTPLYFIFGLIILTDLIDTAGQLILKSTINSLDVHINSFAKVLCFISRLVLIPRLWIGLLFSATSLFIWLFVLTRAELNLAYSLDSMRYIFIAFASMMILKEPVGKKRWLGILSIVFGIILVTCG